jgi:hypothetical protein
MLWTGAPELRGLQIQPFSPPPFHRAWPGISVVCQHAGADSRAAGSDGVARVGAVGKSIARPRDLVVSEKTDGAGIHCGCSGLPAGGCEPLGPSQRGKLLWKGSVGGKRVHAPRCRGDPNGDSGVYCPQTETPKWKSRSRALRDWSFQKQETRLGANFSEGERKTWPLRMTA